MGRKLRWEEGREWKRGSLYKIGEDCIKKEEKNTIVKK